MHKSVMLYFLFILILCSCKNCSGDRYEKQSSDTTRAAKNFEDNLPSNPLKSSIFTAALAHTVAANTIDTIHNVLETFSELRMGDNSKLFIDPSLDSCQINIQSSFIGENCEILAIGETGVTGTHGVDLGNENGHGQNGAPGGTGGIGGEGGKGKFVKIFLGLNKLGTLKIISKGGKGGTGGTGGKGQRGGNAQRFIHSGGNGGSGGVGGSGGTGGVGGEVFVNFWFNDSPINVEGKFNVNVDGGNPGSEGTGGIGGGGGNAINSPPGKRSGGNPGPSGAPGGGGQIGKRGPFPDVRPIRKPS